MSARVLNPAMMTEMSRNIGAVLVQAASSGNTAAGRVAPSRAALARVRRDLFGPVDHAAAKALADRELKAQSILDAERWGFDFRLEVPKTAGHPRYEWELITSQDVVPEPYALRGMPYLRKASPATPRKAMRSPRLVRIGSESPASPITFDHSITTTASPTLTPAMKMQPAAERTPPQESRVPISGEKTPDVVPAIAELSFRSSERIKSTTPTRGTAVLSARKVQPAITG